MKIAPVQLPIAGLALFLVTTSLCAPDVSADRPPAPPRQGSPVTHWKSGDWWEVQLEQLALYSATPMGWTPTYRLRFRVVQIDEKEARVEVRRFPEDRFPERLELRYAPDGELISALVFVENRGEPLGPAGNPGVFGMLGRQAFELPDEAGPITSETPREPGAGDRAANVGRTPVTASRVVRGKDLSDPDRLQHTGKRRVRVVRIPLDAGGRFVQTWASDDFFWRQFETSDGLPQRGTLVGASWRLRRVRRPAIAH